MTSQPVPPPADELTYRQHQGWACCWCGASLWTPTGGVSVGRARSTAGWSIEVYACSQQCPQRPHLPRSIQESASQEGTP